MTTPDPTRARMTDAELFVQFDAYWLGGARDARETSYGYARKAYITAYRAASASSELERVVVEKALRFEELGSQPHNPARPTGYYDAQDELCEAVVALRAHRAPVDHLAEALALIDKAQVHSRTDSDQEQYLDDARQHIEAAREAGRG